MLTAQLFKKSKIRSQKGAILKQRNLNLILNECLGIKEVFFSNTHKTTHLTQRKAHQPETVLKRYVAQMLILTYLTFSQIFKEFKTNLSIPLSPLHLKTP